MNTYKNIYDVYSQIRLADGIIQVINRIKTPQQVLYNTCIDQLTRNILFK